MRTERGGLFEIVTERSGYPCVGEPTDHCGAGFRDVIMSRNGMVILVLYGAERISAPLKMPRSGAALRDFLFDPYTSLVITLPGLVIKMACQFFSA